MPLPLIAGGVVAAIAAAFSAVVSGALALLGVGVFYSVTTFVIKVLIKLIALFAVMWLMYSAFLALIPLAVPVSLPAAHSAMLAWIAWCFHFADGLSLMFSAFVVRFVWGHVIDLIKATN